VDKICPLTCPLKCPERAFLYIRIKNRLSVKRKTIFLALNPVLRPSPTYYKAE
jgi:hypothetical protein